MATIFQSLAVYCASSTGSNQAIVNEAYRLGKSLAEQQIHLVYGGSKLGLMGQVANGVLENDGKAIGVIPHFLKTKEIVHPQLTQLIETQDMHQRKLKMMDMSDGMVVLPGGFGTLEEFFEVLTWAQLGLHQKPIGLLNIDGYYDELLRFFSKMCQTELLKEANLDLLCIADNVDELLNAMKIYLPQSTPKWI